MKMKKVDINYLLYKLITIAAFTIAINIAMRKEFSHPYLISGIVGFVGVSGSLKASDMSEYVSSCLRRKGGFGRYVGEALFFIGFAVVSLAVFRYLSFSEEQIKAFVFGVVSMGAGGYIYLRRCSRESK